MAPTPTTAAATRKTVPSPHALLDSLSKIVIKYANEHLTEVGTRLVSTLLDVSDPALDARSVFLRVKSGNLLKSNNYAFFHITSEVFEKSLKREIEALLPSPLKQGKLIESGSLSLVPFEEMDNRVTFDAISRPFEMQYASQIATLNVRLGFLLERDILRIAQNPFRPEMFLSAIHQAWREFEPDADAHGLIVPMLRPALLFDLAPLYDSLCDALMNKGVQPNSMDAFNIKKTESAAAAKKAKAKSQAALAKQLRQFLAEDGAADNEFGADIPMIPDLPAMAPSAGGWRPSGAEQFQGPAMAMPAAPAPVLGQGQGQGGGQKATPHVAQFLAPQQHGGGYPASHNGGGAPLGQHGGGYPAHPEQLGQFIGQFVGAGQGGGAPMMATPQLMEMLKHLQTRMPEQFTSGPASPAELQAGNVFYLPRLKESMPKGSLSRGDESTIDLLSKIFETVFLDANIPKEVRDLIQFLQIPVLKSALADKNFFYEEAHPARRMIDLLSRMGLEQRKAPDDPLYQAMKRSVDRVGEEASSEDSAKVFGDAVAELEESIKADEHVAVNAIAAPIAAALKQEKVTAATRSAKTAVAARVGSGEVVAMLETFLEKKWTSVLTVAYSVEDDKPGAVGNATKTMDDLIWSVKPKITHEERKNLIAKLPALLATLNKWLDIIKWQDADRLQFFAELAECHASIVRAPLDITPERQLEIAVEVAQQDAVRRLEKDQAAAAAVAVAPVEVDEALLAVETLERNMWLEFTPADGNVRKVKLAWISPLRTLFIFSTGARQEAFSLSAEKLADAYRNNQVRQISMDGMVERALSKALEQAVNDPVHTQSNAA